MGVFAAAINFGLAFNRAIGAGEFNWIFCWRNGRLRCLFPHRIVFTLGATRLDRLAIGRRRWAGVSNSSWSPSAELAIRAAGWSGSGGAAWSGPPSPASVQTAGQCSCAVRRRSPGRQWDDAAGRHPVQIAPAGTREAPGTLRGRSGWPAPECARWCPSPGRRGRRHRARGSHSPRRRDG